MQKSTFWIILVLFMIGMAMMIGLFIGRITSGDRIVIEKDETLPESAENTDYTEGSLPSIIDGKININTADIELLMYLPGVGQTLALRIIGYRTEHGPFTDLNQLLNVSGIGEAKLESIIDYITIGD